MYLKKFFFIILIILVGGLVVVSIFSFKIRKNDMPAITSNAQSSIVLHTYGFSPKELKIKKGTTVNFTSDANREFWPASDIHPTHLIYPEFDPQQPIASGSAWSFTFNKVGHWRFHDHLSPTTIGSMTVTQ